MAGPEDPKPATTTAPAPTAEVPEETAPAQSTAPEGDSGPAIEVADPDDYEHDEFDPVDTESAASTSVTSSIYAHNYEGGRRYLSYKNARYPIPNDDIEQNREDMKHALMLELTDGKLFFAPIGDNPQKIIDLGTGTGIWPIEVADMFPSAEVIGVDMTPIQPTWVPPNLRFIVDDIEEEWLNGKDFDFVHLRQIMPVLKNVDKVIAQSFENIRPGGWIEIQEFDTRPFSEDNTLPSPYYLQEFMDLSAKGLAQFGNDFLIGHKLGDRLRKAGFVNVTLNSLKIPIGTWPKDKRMRLIGLYFRTIMEALLGAFSGRVLPSLGMSEVEVQVFAAKLRQELKDDRVHGVMPYLFWSAQKPL